MSRDDEADLTFLNVKRLALDGNHNLSPNPNPIRCRNSRSAVRYLMFIQYCRNGWSVWNRLIRLTWITDQGNRLTTRLICAGFWYCEHYDFLWYSCVLIM